VLNPRLFRQLQRAFGVVKISREDEPLNYSLNNRVGAGNIRASIGSGGECYRICCPVCGDERFRCYINHRYGTTEEKTGRPFNELTRLFNCFNEDSCNRSLGDILEKFTTPYMCRGIKGYSVSNLEESNVIDNRVPSPGKCTRVDNLPEDHVAVRYLTDRKFDYRELGRDYHMAYCTESEFSYARGRLIIPILQQGILCGWQARYLYPIPDKGSLIPSRISGTVTDVRYHDSGLTVVIDNEIHEYPQGTWAKVRVGDEVKKGRRLSLPVNKYMTGLNSPLRKLLYNGDKAINYNYLVLVEGVFDAVRFGPPAVAVFGKTLATLQLRSIATTFCNRPIFVMFDSGAEADMSRVVKRLGRCDTKGVFPVSIEGQKDPGDCDPGYLHNLVGSIAEREGLTIGLS